MVIDDLYTFDRLAESCGNRYLAVMFLSESARKLGSKKKDYQIAESKLLQWVLTGTCPYSNKQLDRMKKKVSDDGIENILSWVSDQFVVDKVRFLYKSSIRRRKLLYYRDSKLTKSKVDRINILLRMIWYSTTV